MTAERLHLSISAHIIAALLAVAACGSAPGHSSASETPVRISGEFVQDGSCRVTVDDVALFGEGEKARTVYRRGRALNMAPAGFDVHEIWCVPASAGEPMLPDAPNERAFFINVYAPSGKLATVQRYVILRGMPTSTGAATGLRANLSLFGHGSSAQVNGYGPGVEYLSGAAGDVTLTHVDSALVAGTFRALAVRERSMM